MTFNTSRLICAVLVLQHGSIHAHHFADVPPIPQGFRERVYSGSRDAPMGSWFNRNLDRSSGIVSLRNHFQAVDEKLGEALRERSSYGLSPDDTFCNQKMAFAESAFQSKLETLGLPPVPVKTCITELKIDLDNDQQDDLWRNRWELIAASKMAGRAAVSELKLIHWSDAYTHANFTYADHIHRCEVLHNVGIRVRGEWGVMISVTQHPISLLREDRRREYQTEYLTFQDGKVGNILLSLPNLDHSGRYVNDTTTTRENWSGKPSASIFRTVKPLGDNPALSTLLRSKQEWREQVQDSRTPSNIAILVLSCLIALVPISLFTEASMFIIILYAVATDIISCVPLIIKGVELMHSSSKHSDTVVWAYGPYKPRESTLVVESWSAKCTAKNDVRRIGLGLLCAALVFMSVGILIEAWMIQRLKRAKQMGKLKRVAFEEAVCTRCACYDEVRSDGTLQKVPRRRPTHQDMQRAGRIRMSRFYSWRGCRTKVYR